MKILIEPLDRTCHGPESVADALEEPPHSRLLAIEWSPQQHNQWCWAAVAGTVAAYYGDASWSQERVARALMAESGEETDGALNRPAHLDKALDLVGCLANWSAARPPFRRLMRELDGGRPLALAVDWHRGGRHFLIVVGYVRGRREITIHDPREGPVTMNFDLFPKRYRDGGVWAETYWTKPPHAADSEEET